MNVLLDRLPTEIFISGKPVPIASDFRTWILFEQLNLDKTLSEDQKAEKSLRLVFPDLMHIPLNEPKQIIERLMWFYRGGDRKQNEYQLREQKRSEARQNAGDETSTLYYDYDFDADYIYAAYMQQYGVDLSTSTMHWWKFRAMFAGLTDKTKFVQIMGYRAAKIDKDMTESQKRFYKRMKKMYALPLPQDEQEKTRAIEDALQGGDITLLMQLLGKGGGNG